jgi:hypothetical protein
MCEAISRFNHLAEILIVDNASTYAPLLAWYKTCPYRVIRLPNVGHTAAWLPQVQAAIETDLYVVSDPDLDLSGVPPDALQHLADLLLKYPAQGKVGLSLEINDYTPDLPFYPINAHIEASYWRAPPLDDVALLAPVDTTFAMYHKHIMSEYRICGCRTLRPYTARHLPWYVRSPDEEFTHYLLNANSSSSFKVHLPQMKRPPERGP